MFAQRRFPSFAATVALMLCLTACFGWSTQGVTPQSFFQQENPDRVRVITNTNDTLVLRSTVVRGDSLIGRVESSRGAAGSPIHTEAEHSEQMDTYFWLPISEIREVATEKESLGSVIAGTAVGVGYLVWDLFHPSSDDCDGYCPE